MKISNLWKHGLNFLKCGVYNIIHVLAQMRIYILWHKLVTLVHVQSYGCLCSLAQIPFFTATTNNVEGSYLNDFYLLIYPLVYNMGPN